MGRKEEWRVINQYPHYEVSSKGNVRHIGKSNRKLGKNVNGYPTVYIRHNGKYKCLLVHRLVAMAFIPNPQNKPHINHKDGNKENGCVENLEWCTPSENERHKVNVLGVKQNPPHISKPVVCVETDRVYASIQYAAKDTGTNYRHIGEVANGKRKTAGGFHWRFADV